jgi:DNA-binding transcriptional ArsR family regulator
MFNRDEVCELVHIDPARVTRLRRVLARPDEVTGLAETFRALGDTTRVRMLDALSHGELCVCDLAAVIGLTQSAVSHQLRLLKSVRLVRARRDGRMVFYSLDDQHIISIFKQTLQHVGEDRGARGGKGARGARGAERFSGARLAGAARGAARG